MHTICGHGIRNRQEQAEGHGQLASNVICVAQGVHVDADFLI